MGKKENNTSVINNELVTADRNLLVKASMGMSGILNQFGYKSKELEHDGNKYQLTLKNVNGGADIVKTIEVHERIAKAFNDLATVENFKTVENHITAWNLKLVEPAVKKMGYNSVADFAELNYGMKPNWANQLLNVAKAFITEDENGPCFKYEWCNNVPFSNLALILGRINKMDGETLEDKIEAFHNAYLVPIDETSSNVLNLAKQGELKKQLEALNEKDGTSKKRTKKDETKAPEITPLASLAMVAEWLEVHKNIIDDETYTRYHSTLSSIEMLIVGSEKMTEAPEAPEAPEA